MSELIKTIKEIQEGLSQRSSSQKDEVKVMQSMLNDKEFSVDVYGKGGVVGTYSPFEESRKLVSSIVKATTKVSDDESKFLASEFQFSKNDSTVMVGLSKEFVNTYLQTGRKLPLGGRAESNISLMEKEVSERTVTVPNRGENGNGSTVDKLIPAHKSIKVKAGCPDWKK